MTHAPASRCAVLNICAAQRRQQTVEADLFEHMFYHAPVSANPPKHDAWLPYKDVRFVLVRSIGRLKPCRGLILDWRRNGRKWEAQVVYYDDAALEPVTKLAWLEQSQLIPVPVDPNYGQPKRGRR